MKKIRFIKTTAFFLLLAGGMACDSIFDVEPSTQISTATALGTEAGIEGLRTNMYSKMVGSFDMTTELLVGASALADETFNRRGSTRFQALTNAFGGGGVAHIAPFGAYEVIQEANLLINEIPDGVLDPEVKNQYVGEALAIRAFAYHALVRAYGYEPGNFSNGPVSNWDAGVMLRTNATTDLADAEPIPRSTVTEVYAQMVADLDQAIALLDANDNGLSNNRYVTHQFAQAMKARVLLYQGNWAGARDAAAAAITASGLSLVNTEAGVAAMWSQENPEALFELKVNASTENIAGSNNNNGLAVYTSTQWVSQNPTNYVINAYDPADWRLSGWYAFCAATGCEAANDDTLMVTKWNGYKGNYVDDIPMFRIAELYLIQAEAAAKAGTIADGIAPLNALKAARNAPAVAAGDFANMTAFENEILLERTRELIVEGHRFWDLKRLGRNVYDGRTGDGFSGDIKMRADSYRILAPFGTAYQAVNPLAVENPQYETVE